VSALAPSGSTRIRREYAIIQRGMARVGPTPHLFEAERYAPEAVRLVRDRWSGQLADEHRSTFVFSALAGQMAEAGAGVDMVAVMLRMAQDELRHTSTCGEVVRALGGDPAVPVLTRVPLLAAHAGESARQRALRNVLLTTCISELHAVAVFVASLDGIEDGYLRDRTREVLADEVLHGELGFIYLEAAMPWLRESERELSALARYLRFAFAWAERELAPREAAALSAKAPSPDAIRLGMVPFEVRRDLYQRTMFEAVVPAFERLGVPAEDAWRRRALA